MIPNVIWLIPFSSFLPFILFNAEAGEFRANFPKKNYLHKTFVEVYFSHTS